MICAAVGTLAVLVLAFGERAADVDWRPRTVTLSGKSTLSDALALLEKQTGNVVNDRRKERSNPTLLLMNKTGTFWQTLDAIGKESGIGFSPYQEDGGVALVDSPYRELKVDHSGMFRFAFKRISVSRDEETQARLCHIALEAAWEPRLKLLFLNFDKGQIAYQANRRAVREDLPRQAADRVTGTRAVELNLRCNAPERSTAKLDALSGAIRAVAIPKMLEFQFAKPAENMKDEKDGVKVRVRAVKTDARQWAVDLEYEHPPGAFDILQSFERDSWMFYNRVWLAWRDAKTQKTVELDPAGESDSKVGPGTVYRFQPAPPKDAVVTLHFRTANRVAAFTTPFSFRDLALP
jgi:hypothetical protein